MPSIKKNLIFLPGMMCDGRIFQNQIDYLEDICNIELANLTTFNSIELISKEILRKTQFSSFYLCGLSMGGIVAMELLKQVPNRIDGLILIDTNYLAEKPDKQVSRDQQLERIYGGAFKTIIQEEVKPFYLYEDESFLQNQQKNDLMQLFYHMALDLGEKVFVKQSQALKKRTDYTSIIAKFKKKALIICGRQDSLCTTERHLEMADIISKSSLFILEKCGHIANLEHPELVNQIIKNWFLIK